MTILPDSDDSTDTKAKEQVFEASNRPTAPKPVAAHKCVYATKAHGDFTVSPDPRSHSSTTTDFYKVDKVSPSLPGALDSFRISKAGATEEFKSGLKLFKMVSSLASWMLNAWTDLFHLFALHSSVPPVEIMSARLSLTMKPWRHCHMWYLLLSTDHAFTENSVLMKSQKLMRVCRQRLKRLRAKPNYLHSRNYMLRRKR